MATLNGEPIYVHDSVYDIVHGPGRVIDTSGGDILVSFGSAGRPRKYSSGGITGRTCYRTLYPRPPIVIELPRCETDAAKLTCAAQEMMGIFQMLTSCTPPPCAPPAPPCCPDPCCSGGCR